MAPHSCGHRNCPHCQHFESQQWIERQTQRRVPGRYFLITFTLPVELRPLGTLRTFSQNHQQLQGSPGAVAVLHTHSRRLDFHPHVHVAMPAGALDAGTPTPRANPGASLGPCLAMTGWPRARQAGCEAQGDGFYSRSPNLRRLKNSVESRFRSLDRAQRNRGRFSAPDFIAFHPGYACYWEHLIRDDEDFRRHVDYIHFNPVKHGYVERAADWPHSSIHRFIRDGLIPLDWATEGSSDGDWGERR